MVVVDLELPSLRLRRPYWCKVFISDLPWSFCCVAVLSSSSDISSETAWIMTTVILLVQGSYVCGAAYSMEVIAKMYYVQWNKVHLWIQPSVDLARSKTSKLPFGCLERLGWPRPRAWIPKFKAFFNLTPFSADKCDVAIRSAKLIVVENVFVMYSKSEMIYQESRLARARRQRDKSPHNSLIQLRLTL